MQLNDIGEKEFIRRLLPQLSVHPRFLNGFGHDASVLDFDETTDQVLVTKIDRAAQPTATRRGWSDYRMWGRLAVTASCSDLLATGAEPKGFMVAAVLPGTFLIEHAEQIFLGCEEECMRRDVAFVGGDTKEGLQPELIGSAFGTARRGRTLGRLGAKPGDLVVVAGQLGGYLGAYMQMTRGFANRSTSQWGEWQQYVTHPQAQWLEAREMSRTVGVVAAMDTSDGLYDALSVLAGDFGIRVVERSLPFHRFATQLAAKTEVSELNSALGVGDWNIVYVVRPAAEARIGQLIASGLDLAIIGQVVESSSITVVAADKTSRTLRRVVNEHFSSRQEDEGSYLDMVSRSPYLGDE